MSVEPEQPSPGLPEGVIRIRAEFEVKITLEAALELYLSDNSINRKGISFHNCVIEASNYFDEVVFHVTKKRNIMEGRRREWIRNQSNQ